MTWHVHMAEPLFSCASLGKGLNLSGLNLKFFICTTCKIWTQTLSFPLYYCYSAKLKISFYLFILQSESCVLIWTPSILQLMAKCACPDIRKRSDMAFLRSSNVSRLLCWWKIAFRRVSMSYSPSRTGLMISHRPEAVAKAGKCGNGLSLNVDLCHLPSTLWFPVVPPHQPRS